MNRLTYTDLAKRLLGLAGLVVAGTVATLPASAQVAVPSESDESGVTEEVESPAESDVLGVPAAPSASDYMNEATSEPGAVLETAPESAELESAPSADALDTPEVPSISTEEATPDTVPVDALPIDDVSTDDAPVKEPAADTLSPEAEPTGLEDPMSDPTSEQPTPNQVAAAEGTIVDVATANSTFQTLVQALTEAELAEVLNGEGPFTVFAPTDEAFAALPPGTLEALLAPENRQILVQLLTYHVVPGNLTSDQLASGEVTTAEGSPVLVTVNEGEVMVNDANVIQADIPATNGVIHAIDRVIVPPGL